MKKYLLLCAMLLQISAFASANVADTSNEDIIVTHPKYASSGLQISNIIITPQYTILDCLWKNRAQGDSCFNINPYAYLVDRSSGKKYGIVTSYGFAIAPDTTIVSCGTTTAFALYFEPIPTDTKTIDFIEDSNSRLNCRYIKLTNK